MDLNRIAVFVRVVDAGSFTRASAALGVRKSSVSRSVAALEAALGIRSAPPDDEKAVPHRRRPRVLRARARRARRPRRGRATPTRYLASSAAAGDRAAGPGPGRPAKDPGCGPAALKTEKPPSLGGFSVEAPGIESGSLGARWALREDISGHMGAREGT